MNLMNNKCYKISCLIYKRLYKKTPSLAYLQERNALMEKTNYSVARVVTYTKQSISKAERHNERKNQSYSNMNVDLEQTKNNVYYKTCDKTYNERLKELIDENKVSLRGLKDNAKIFETILKNTEDTILQRDFMKKPSTLQKQNMVKIILYLLLCTQMNKILH